MDRTAEEVLRETYGDDTDAIMKDMRREIDDAIQSAPEALTAMEWVEDVLANHGLEPDYLPEFV